MELNSFTARCSNPPHIQEIVLLSRGKMERFTNVYRVRYQIGADGSLWLRIGWSSSKEPNPGCVTVSDRCLDKVYKVLWIDNQSPYYRVGDEICALPAGRGEPVEEVEE